MHIFSPALLQFLASDWHNYIPCRSVFAATRRDHVSHINWQRQTTNRTLSEAAVSGCVNKSMSRNSAIFSCMLPHAVSYMISLTFVAAVFHKIAATIAVLQIDSSTSAMPQDAQHVSAATASSVSVRIMIIPDPREISDRINQG